MSARAERLGHHSAADQDQMAALGQQLQGNTDLTVHLQI